MKEFTIMSYNIENMKKIFYKGKINPEKKEKAEAIARVISDIKPDILGIIEASNKLTDHEGFLKETELSVFNYKIAKSEKNRGRQDLVLYYREPFELVSIDESKGFYDQWIEDIDEDGIEEVFKFERQPLEAVFRIKNTDILLMVILVSTKSKGVFSINDFLSYQKLALANKKLLAQSKKIRSRIELLIENETKIPFILMGDFNDEPGFDSYEKFTGASSLEVVMGSVFEPEKILHNTIWHISKTKNKKDLWTIQFPDPIVENSKEHKAWLDHIFVSPNMIIDQTKLKYIKDSGEIAPKNDYSKKASDHYPVFCKIGLTL